jgi:hypothetical protein
MKIEMTRDFSLKGTPLKKGEVLTVHTAFKKKMTLIQAQQRL